ncbi:hypothetical protein TrST_g10108 [Triparma strigata]|uniref:Yippee domain-containing protein n=1 Tax=Triparma strigata TaxID=1606541 RepID=A0A9W7AA88_9STRA|nr:hypothetical protein TrST_g10108 [Triparma strigata]
MIPSMLLPQSMQAAAAEGGASDRVVRNRARTSSRGDIDITVESVSKQGGDDENRETTVHLQGPKIYSCGSCRTHLTSSDDIISKSFHGRNGRAYLFDSGVNVTLGEEEDRMLMTGLHKVCDLKCSRCDSLLGWTYVKAYEASQKYKEGKFIFEKMGLYLEESEGAGGRGGRGDVGGGGGGGNTIGGGDRWRKRTMSWGEGEGDDVYEYEPE